MKRYDPENERVKRDYAFFLEAANGKQNASIDAALRAIERFEVSTGRKAFRKFHIEQARSFRARLLEEKGTSGKPLSAATMTTTLKHLRNFFLWLSREPGFRAALNANDANYFTPSDQDLRVATARRDKRVASLEEICQVLAAMFAKSPIEKRDRALVAFTILSGARDSAIASLRLKHVDLKTQTVFQDGREVKTKRRKTFTSTFFPVGPEPLEIVRDYIAMLTGELGFGPEDALFPATLIGRGDDRGFTPIGLSREHWRTAAPIRRIFRDAFAAAGLLYAKPHSFRDTLAQLGERLCRTPEEWKAWSQNLGHESEATTFVGYGHVPAHRQSEILRALAKPRPSLSVAGLDINALEDFLRSAKGAALASTDA
ncbi:tyrosine-type recombinase/integrase [Sediminibacterium sp.]|uniref:tyrosine-type recombinase/integrase n=1 Tax=Sediminibacterium sp. TaxID=1917865 RepID=UPI002737445C|nr:tyrosine-type recombinase/integrase [Sediminibacterium sp.]MDP3566412.1 tyrosine-type recombinase/integrase [Sediminibacterium sp.]